LRTEYSKAICELKHRSLSKKTTGPVENICDQIPSGIPTSPAESVQGSSISTSSQPNHTPSLHESTISRSDLATKLAWKFRPPEFPRARAKVTQLDQPAHGQTESRICAGVADFRDSELSQPPRRFGAYHISDRRSRGSHGTDPEDWYFLRGVACYRRIGSAQPDCKVLDWCVAPAGRRSHRGWEISTLKAHRQDLADLTGRSGTPRKRPSDESSE